MRNPFRLLATAAVAALALLAPDAALAQGVTTAGIEGRVTDSSGAPVVGAEVSGVHTPSGTSYRTTTRTGGVYNLTNVRIGGPYSVTVAGPGGAAKRINGVNAELQQSTRVDIVLPAAAPAVLGTVIAQEAGGPARVVVEATAIDDELFSPTRQGAVTNVGRDKIDTLPTISRSLQDFTRLTPQASGGSVAGGNNRFNNISIDGATINDSFGLSASGLLTDRAEPISLDVIDQVRISISPYDVRQSNFTGGAIDAVTKSGTNTFHGSIYGFYRDGSLVGRDTFTVNGLKHAPLNDFEEYTYGLTFGGPIIKDRLFFFFGAESKRRREPQLGAIGGAGSSIFGDPNGPAALNTAAVINTSITRYNYNPGGTGVVLDRVKDDKIFARIDWNITKDQKLTLRYNHIDAVFTDGISRDNSSFSLSGRQFQRPSESNSFVGQLISTWSSKFTTEARVAYNRLRTERTVSIPFPAVSVLIGSGQSVNFGVERSSQQNALDQDIIESVINGSYYLGNHTITGGVNVDHFQFRNLFIQDVFGNYAFNSPADYAIGRPQSYQVSYLQPGGSPVVDWGYYNIGLYLQDEWKITPKLTATFGLRADLPVFPDSPRSNAQFATDFGGRDTGKLPEGNWSISPRFGFNWNIFGDLNAPTETEAVADAKGVVPTSRTRSWRDEFATVVRGGIGLFNGRTPSVYISNQYSNTGLDFARIARTYGSATFGGATAGSQNFFTPNPFNQPQAGANSSLPSAAQTTTAIALTSSDFKFPSILRTNLAIDQKLPFGLVFTVEGLYSRDIDAVFFKNLAQSDIGLTSFPVATGTVATLLGYTVPAGTLSPLPAGTLPDGRPIYRSNPALNSNYNPLPATDPRARYTNVIEFGNVSKGDSYFATVSLERPLQKDGWSAKIAYTRSKVRTATDSTSSVAFSNFQNRPISFDANNSAVGRSFFEIKDRIIANLNYSINVGKPWQTTLGLIYDGHSGTPYSFIFSNDANNDGVSGNDLFFVPSDPSQVRIISSSANTGNSAATNAALNAQATATFFDFINSNEYLKANRGKILPRNGGTNPWVNRLDFRLSQQIPTPSFGNFKGKLEVYFDVLNVLNLFGKNLGGIKTYGGTLFNTVSIATFSGIDPQGRYIYTYNPTTSALRSPAGTSVSYNSGGAGQANIDSRWQIQFGARYTF